MGIYICTQATVPMMAWIPSSIFPKSSASSLLSLKAKQAKAIAHVIGLKQAAGCHADRHSTDSKTNVYLQKWTDKMPRRTEGSKQDSS